MTTVAALEKIGSAWVHPKTGEIRYYIDAEKAAEMAGISGTAYGEGSRALSKREFGQVLGCKFWLDSEGELHIQGHLPLTVLDSDGFRTAEDLIREAVAQALAEAEPVEVVTAEVDGESEQDDEEPEDDMTVTTEVPATMVEGEATATSGSWTPDDSTVDALTVTEEECDHDLPCFVVTMVRDGETREQVIHPFSPCAVGPIRSDLDQGESPIGWDDGLGRMVCWENAAPVGGEE